MVPKFQKWVTWPHPTPLTKFCIFFFRTHRHPYLCRIWSVQLHSFRRYKGVPKFQKWVMWPRMTPFNLILIFFSLVLTAIHLCVEFEVSSFIGFVDTRRSQNSQSVSCDPHPTPFDPIFHVFISTHLLPNLKFLASSVSEVLGGPKIPKVGHVTLTWSIFDLILHFFLSTHCHTSLCQIWSF